ncbi:MAG: ComF family protein [Alphaproteobacteria bacterium]|nr:ComF family protein [Alphaproteobacteria bacterium]NCQ66231.1 ComF family protein [Alphaproteobacteria bacterium]NCT06579.1 ComF family protein [Alphaproteobacteria bacterium]
MARGPLKKILQFLLPARCLVCRDVIEEQGHICASCWGDLTFLSDAKCDRCGIPFEVIDLKTQDGAGENALTCPSCLKDPPPFHRSVSSLLYDDKSKDLILRFKHGDATHMAPAFGQWLAKAGKDILERTDYLVPVPLHWKRLLKRQYNQAALLVNELEKVCRVPALLEGLERTSHTPTQGYLTKEERHTNVSGKFVVPSKNKNIVNKKVITIVDDVYTSGATAKACAEALQQEGVSEINILTLARVARL